jgi:head-tail adaptor
MIARNYTRLVDFYKTENVADGFGGNTVSESLIGSYWSEVKNERSFNDTAQGTDVIKNTYIFQIRVNDFIEPHLNNLSIIYNGQKYIVNNFEYLDMLFRFIKITATISIGEEVNIVPFAIFQDSFITLLQNGDNLIFQ